MVMAVLWLLIAIDRLLLQLPAGVGQRLRPTVMKWEITFAQRLIHRLRSDVYDLKHQMEQMNERIKRLSDISSEDDKD